MDARRRRSAERLHAAVLSLATRTPVTELTVTQVADAAGVHRSTFYEHADSVVQLLQQALLVELDELRARLDEPSDEVVRAVTLGVLEHVRAHAAIYRRGLQPEAGPAGLHGMLAEHFLESGRQLVRSGSIVLPLSLDDVDRDVLDDAALHFVATGTVGVLQAWLAVPGDPRVATFESAYAALLPSWWAWA